jgi:streptomycin 6-kinase
VALKIPARLAANSCKTPERAAWLERLPYTLSMIEKRWSFAAGAPFDNEDVSCAWVAPVVLSDGTPAVLKLGMPHVEGANEIDGLRLWGGDSTVRLLKADDDLGAMLLERCQPGTALRSLPEPGQDVVVSGLLRQLWRVPSAPHPFRHLSVLMKHWAGETQAQIDQWPDRGLVDEGLRLLAELSRPAPTDVLLATDLHAGNVLRAERKPWLVIDPKPFIGDPAYDSTQHLFNCAGRLLSDPNGLICRFAELLRVDRERVRLWTFARAAAEPREDWRNERWTAIARATAP